MRGPLTVLAAVLLLVAAGGCLGEPARTNPFDARSDAFAAVGSVSGRVLDGVAQPLPGAAVRLEARPEAAGMDSSLVLATRTGGDGAFVFDEVPAGGYRLVARREPSGVTAERLVEVEAARRQEVLPLVLDAPPLIAEADVDAVHRRGWAVAPGDVYLLEVEARVVDPETGADGVAAVWLEVPALAFADTLRPDGAGSYRGAIQAERLPGASLQALVGLKLALAARDAGGGVTRRAPLRIERVVEEVPVAAAPDSLEGTEARPLLRWAPFGLPYPFTLLVRIDRLEGELVLPVWRREGVAPTETSVRPDQALAPGVYRWTVAAVDAFGNRGRSAPAVFRVEP